MAIRYRVWESLYLFYTSFDVSNTLRVVPYVCDVLWTADTTMLVNHNFRQRVDGRRAWTSMKRVNEFTDVQ